MRKITQQQLSRMDDWMRFNARPYDLAKWDYLFNGGSKDSIVDEMLKYRNEDGGIGNGFESDILCPLSGAIPTAEAVFQSYEYGLDCNTEWFKSLLVYFESSVQDIPKYWEDCPKELMNYPHAPWWRYKPATSFSPNPCAVIASALIRYGTESQKTLGYKVADDCIRFLIGNAFCGDHDTLNIKALIDQLIEIDSPIITDEVLSSMKRRILENTCFDTSKYNSYYFSPLDFVSSPDSLWYDTVKHGIEQTIDYWLDNINEHGVWTPNFSWGVNSAEALKATKNWTGYITVKRAKILLNFGRIEGNLKNGKC